MEWTDDAWGGYPLFRVEVDEPDGSSWKYATNIRADLAMDVCRLAWLTCQPLVAARCVNQKTGATRDCISKDAAGMMPTEKANRILRKAGFGHLQVR